MKKCSTLPSAFVVAAVMGAAHSSTREAQTQGASCFVTTISGDVQGLDLGASCAFLGIPFAEPPIGDLRWKPPQPAAVWAPATLNAIVAPAFCPQINPAGSTGAAGSEDCLKLNIWTPDPAPASPAPVIVWIPTGAFQAASASIADSNGRNMAERTGAIVVAANYRLGPFGFLGHSALTAENPGYPSSGNYGFLDQRAALAWVRDHIAAFGGNPDNVTIAGQSAGSHSVSFHLVSPGSAGYFNRAIMQSGYASSLWQTRADTEALGHDFAAAVGCTDPSQVLACMRSKTRNEVLLAFPNGQQVFSETARIPWGPVVDGLDIPDQPRRLYERGAFNRVPIIIGATRDEGWIYVDRSFPAGLTADQYQTAVETEFGAAEAPAILSMYPIADFPTPKHALSQLTGDFEAVCEARRVARLVSRTGTPVYQYSFEREADAVVPDLVIHGLDRNFVFGNNFGPPSNYVLNADDLTLFGAISDYWARFAAAGNPNRRRHDRRELAHDGDGDNGGDDDGDDDGAVRWPAFKHAHGRGRGADKYIVLDVPIREDSRLREPQCDFWEPYFLGPVFGSVPASSAANDFCGVTIGANLKLDHDLTCSGNGITVGADGITLDLNGHTITGSGVGVGISVVGRTRVSVVGGTVRNFVAGVRVTDSTRIVVEGNTLRENTDGVDCQAGCVGNTIKENEFWDNRSRGIMFRSNSRENMLRENTFTGNRVGILVFGGVDSTVKDNLVSASGLAGIRVNVLATGNLIRENTITSNPAGIEFTVTPTGSANGNRFIRNTVATNTCGVKGPVGDNTFKKNLFKENGADSCP